LKIENCCFSAKAGLRNLHGVVVCSEPNKTKGDDMTQYSLNKGICSNCNFASTCLHSFVGMQFCEEYEIAGSFQKFKESSGPSEVEAIKLINPKEGESRSSDKILGLCSNCLNRETCRFSKPESGVWHCEEYA
jgi:hypothetical protein